jgi:hypothetical protein
MSERASLSPSTGATQREGLTCGDPSISCWSSAIGWMLIGPGDLSFFTMDNLNIHKHPVILDVIHVREHRVIFRASYWSCDGAIEYVFNTLQTWLQMDVYGVDTVFDLVNKINTIIGGLPSFKRYFLHVGFPDN